MEFVSDKIDFNKYSKVRFRNNKPYLIKKIFITLLSAGLFIYFLLTLPLVSSIILFLVTLLPLLIKIKKQPSEGKGLFGKLKNFYKNLYKDYVIDELPINISINNEQIRVTLYKAELINNKPVTEVFDILKDKIPGILYDDTQKDVLIMFEEANIKVFNEKTGSLMRKTLQTNATICFNVSENEDIVEQLKSFQYPVDILSEIENGKPETEDPELKEKTESASEEINSNEVITENIIEENPTVTEDNDIENQQITQS